MLRSALRKIKHIIFPPLPPRVDLAPIQILQGVQCNNQIKSQGVLRSINEAEFKVFSQFGEDGIIQYLTRMVALEGNELKFIEFGVQNYEESNTRFLLLKDNWRGLIIDGDYRNINYIKNNDIYWRHDLTAISSFIDTDNINSIINNAGYNGELGILSIDIDGNDYWVWEKINVINPVIVIVEYNSTFGPDHAVTIPYDPSFQRTQAHYSNLYWGCSLKALDVLSNQKGYKLVGSNSAGNNAFFVRKDRLNDLKPKSVEEAYMESKFRESRDENGNLTYLSGKERLDVIQHLPLYDVLSNKTSTIKDLYM